MSKTKENKGFCELIAKHNEAYEVKYSKKDLDSQKLTQKDPVRYKIYHNDKVITSSNV